MPYNPYLSQTFNRDINVEIATSISSVKYLYKYVYKGHDRTAISIQRDDAEVVDEIKDYLDARYISKEANPGLSCFCCERIGGRVPVSLFSMCTGSRSTEGRF